MTKSKAKEIIQGKLDCMNKCGIFNKEDNDNDNDCDNCEYCYSQGTFGEQKEAYQISIDSLEELKAIQDMDLDIPQHFTKEQSNWIKAYCIKRNIEFYNKAIDDFMKAIVDRGLSANDDKYCITHYDNYLKVIKELAEQLKAGDNNGT